MKKLIFFLFFSCNTLIVVCQSIMLSGDTLHYCDPLLEISNHIDVKNISPNDITIICQKTIISKPASLADWAGASYCFAATCYSASSTDPSLPANLASGTMLSYLNGDEDAWSGHYNPNGKAGKTIVEYCFFNQNDSTDMSCLTITYEATNTPLLIDDYQSISKLGDFYPNPTTGMVNFSFTGNLATLELIDILGNKVKEISLNQEGVQNLNLSDLNNGIYFGNLIVNDHVVSVKKLIIK